LNASGAASGRVGVFFRFHLSVCPSVSTNGASFTEKTAMIAAAQKKASDNVAHANAMFR
jgi:hypothetical protein